MRLWGSAAVRRGNAKSLAIAGLLVEVKAKCNLLEERLKEVQGRISSEDFDN